MANNQVRGRAKQGEVEFQATQSDSPLLPVVQIEKLREMNPAWAQWVFDQTTEEANHRRSENKRVNSLIFAERLFATFCALLVALGGFAAAGYCAYIDQPVPASVIGGATLVGLVTAFIAGRKSSK